MSNAFHTKDGAPIPKELRYSYPVDCIFLEYSHHWRLLQGENPLTHHHSWLCWDFLLLLDLPCKGIRQHLMALIPDSEIRQIFACGVRNPGSSVQGIQNTSNDWKLESKFHWQGIRNPVPGIQNPQRRIWNPRLSWITVHGPTNVIKKWASRLESRINNTSLMLGHILLWRHILCKKNTS